MHTRARRCSSKVNQEQRAREKVDHCQVSLLLLVFLREVSYLVRFALKFYSWARGVSAPRSLDSG